MIPTQHVLGLFDTEDKTNASCTAATIIYKVTEELIKSLLIRHLKNKKKVIGVICFNVYFHQSHPLPVNDIQIYYFYERQK